MVYNHDCIVKASKPDLQGTPPMKECRGSTKLVYRRCKSHACHIHVPKTVDYEIRDKSGPANIDSNWAREIVLSEKKNV